MFRILIIITLFFLSNESEKSIDGPCNENLPRGGNQEWGVGVYYMPIDSIIPIYEENSSESAGKLWRDGMGLHLDDSRYVHTKEYVDIQLFNFSKW